MEKVLENGRGGMKDALEQLMNMIESGTGIMTGTGQGSIFHPSRDQSMYWWVKFFIRIFLYLML